MSRGGVRAGAGRKKGTRNKANAAREKAIAESGLTPLDYLLSVMRDETEEPTMRMDAAKAAAPFVHPKLAAIEHTGEMTLTHEQALAELETVTKEVEERGGCRGH